MRSLTVRVPPPDADTRFTAEAAAALIGKPADLKVELRSVVWSAVGTITDAWIVDDEMLGHAMMLTVTEP